MFHHILLRAKSSRAVWNMVASYFAFFSSTAWALVSIPIAVRYLDKESIGLWTTVNATLSYLMWMDFGIAQAAGRLLAPAVAANDQPEINRWWTATSSALWLQACLISMVGLIAIPFVTTFLPIPQALLVDARWLLAAGILVAAASFPLRAVPGLLTAQERFHWVPLISGFVPWVNLGVFYFLLKAGFGVKAYVCAMAAGTTLNWFCFKLLVAFGPQRPRFTRSGISRARMRRLFGFSGGLMILGIVDTVINTLPAIILARFGGLGTVPVYNFSTKGPVLGASVIQRTYQAFQPAWQRSYVSGKSEKFRLQFESTGFLIAGLGTCGSTLILLLNPWLVSRLAGSDYFAGHVLNSWVAVAAITIPIGSYFQSLLTLSGNLGRSPTLFVLKLLLAALSGWMGWNHAGLGGLAAVFSILPLVNAAFGLIIGARNCGYRWRDRLGHRVVLVTCLCIGIVVTCGLAMPGLTPGTFSLDRLQGEIGYLLLPMFAGLGITLYGIRMKVNSLKEQSFISVS